MAPICSSEISVLI